MRRSGCIAIVGAGHAGVQAAASLREGGYSGHIELVSAEHHLPYHRPPLSKRFGQPLDDASIALRPASFYEAQHISLQRGTTAAGIDVADQRLHLSNGRRLAYDHLILATGARNRRLDVAGEELAGIVSVRNLADAQRLREMAGTGGKAVVIGAGYLGLEAAAALRGAGVPVRVVARRSLPLAHAVTSDTARCLAGFLKGLGIEVSGRAAVAGFEGQAGAIRRVRFEDGTVEEADLVVIGIGAAPNLELAASAGLDTAEGILVDRDLLTPQPSISAIGDCAEPRCPAGPVRRLESVHNATSQARRVAARLTGRGMPPPETPWFWSDIGDLRLRIAGLAAEGDAALTIRTAGPGLAVLCFRNGLLVAAETINENGIHVAARKILDSGASLTIDEAGCAGFDITRYAMKLRRAAA